MRLLFISILTVFISTSSIAQDTLKNYFEDQSKQLESWYEVKTYNGSELYHGSFTTYFSNGEIKESGAYSLGQLHGNHKDYFENGEVNISCRYTNGILNGEHKKFYESGNVKERKVYINGKLQGDFKFYKDKKDVAPYLVEKYSMGTKK